MQANEQIVKAITGGHIELATELLKQNKGIIYKTANRYKTLAERNGGATMEDLIQSAALGMLEAVGAWDESRGAFLTIAVYYMRRQCLRLLGLVGRERIENILPPVSLHTPISEESEDVKLLDVLEDKSAENAFCNVELEDMQLGVLEEIKQLPEAERDIILNRWILGKSIKEAANGDYCAGRKHEASAFKALRKNAKLKELAEAFGCVWRYTSAPYKHTTLTNWKYTGVSAVERAAIIRDKELRRLRKHEKHIE